MDAPTASAPAPGVQPVQPVGIDPEFERQDQLEQQADGLMDRIFSGEFDDDKAPEADPEAVKAKGQQPEPPQGEQPAEGEQQPEKEAKAEGEQKAEEPAADDGKEFASLDEYLADQKIDKDSFMELPVTLKVDGKDQTFSLKEVVDGFNLKTVSYERMQQVARDREAFTSEQQQVRQALGVQIQRTEGLLKSAKDLLLGDYANVTQAQIQELRAKDPGAYAAFVTDYNQRVAMIQNLTQQVDQARQVASLEAAKQQRATVASETQKLLSAHPEWRDPAKAASAQRMMQGYAASRGFSEAELNAIYDSRYMEVLHDAAMYHQLKATQNQTLRRVRAAPKMAKPGTRTAADPRAAQYHQTRERALRNPDSPEAMEAWAEQLARA